MSPNILEEDIRSLQMSIDYYEAKIKCIGQDYPEEIERCKRMIHKLKNELNHLLNECKELKNNE